jgi:hypothetical protein
MTKYSSKLGQGPIGPQHSPVTRPESLRSDQFRFECLELGSSGFDLLQCDSLLFSKFLDYCVIERSFQALLCGDGTLFEFSSLAFKFSEQLTCLLLEWLQSLRNVHYFTLQRVYLLLGCGCSANLFILLTGVTDFSCACSTSACCFASWSCASNVCNSGFSARVS